MTRKLTKAESIAYLKSLRERDRENEAAIAQETTVAADAVLPVSKWTVREEVESLETVQQYRHQVASERDALTSDET